MNIQAEKLEIMKFLLDTNNPGILKSIKMLLKKESQVDFWVTLTQEQKDDINKGLKDIENGDILDYEDIMIKHR